MRHTKRTHEEVKALVAKARELRAEGKIYKFIAKELDISTSRAWEYCQGENGVNWDSYAERYTPIAM
jgi:orotate phosphoribosyltransferase-like protein